jgi:uncharacterized phage protein (TIGR01671 family)
VQQAEKEEEQVKEIKFRYIFKHLSSGNIEVKHYFLNQLEERATKELSPCFVADYKLLSRDQYTGLTDKNGKEIFEGDIFKIPDLYETRENTITTYHYEKVYFEHGSFRTDNGKFDEDWDYFSEECEVIGNIYETLELLDK